MNAGTGGVHEPPGYPPVPPYAPSTASADGRQAWTGYRAVGPGPVGSAGYPPYAQARRGTNTMAILAIVFTFVFPALGIVFGAIGRSQTARTGDEGHTLATVSLVLSIVFTAVQVVLVVLWIVFVVLVATHTHGVPDPGTTPFSLPSAQAA